MPNVIIDGIEYTPIKPVYISLSMPIDLIYKMCELELKRREVERLRLKYECMGRWRWDG